MRHQGTAFLTAALCLLALTAQGALVSTRFAVAAMPSAPSTRAAAVPPTVVGPTAVLPGEGPPLRPRTSGRTTAFHPDAPDQVAELFARNNDRPRRWFSVAAGWLAGLALHEAGHIVMGHSSGFKATNTGGVFGELVFDGADGADGRRISTAGFLAQAAGTEVILANDLHRGSDVALGILAFNLSNALFYVAVNELSKGGHEDIAYYKKCGGDTGALYALLLGHTVVSALRLATEVPLGAWTSPEGDQTYLGVRFRF